MFKNFKYVLVLKVIIGILLLTNIHPIFTIFAILGDIFLILTFKNSSKKLEFNSLINKFYLLNQISFFIYLFIFSYVTFLPMNLTLFLIGNFILFFLAIYLEKEFEYFLKINLFLIFSVYLSMIFLCFGFLVVLPILIFWSSVLTFLNFYFYFSIFNKAR